MQMFMINVHYKRRWTIKDIYCETVYDKRTLYTTLEFERRNV